MEGSLIAEPEDASGNAASDGGLLLLRELCHRSQEGRWVGEESLVEKAGQIGEAQQRRQNSVIAIVIDGNEDGDALVHALALAAGDVGVAQARVNVVEGFVAPRSAGLGG